MYKLTWIFSFSDKDLFAPYTVDSDNDYYRNLRKRYTHFNQLLKNANADSISCRIAKKYTDQVCKALREYYVGHVSTSHLIIENLVKGCMGNSLAASTLFSSSAFPGTDEIQFFRARSSELARTFKPKEMLHPPFSKRAKSNNYRFSIPGVSCLYLANSSYGCWIEMGRPSEHDFNVSPVILDGSQKIFNLAVMTRDLGALNEGDEEAIHCWVKLLILMIATSYNVEEVTRTFRSEYIISQAIMLAVKKLGYDGIAYFSKRVDDEVFSQVAINLALFAEYRKNSEYGNICNSIKIDESMNFQMFKQLFPSLTYENYKLRVDSSPYIVNIGNYKYQYSYRETEFYRFDKHLFARWKDKNSLPWGNALC